MFTEARTEGVFDHLLIEKMEMRDAHEYILAPVTPRLWMLQLLGSAYPTA